MGVFEVRDNTTKQWRHKGGKNNHAARAAHVFVWNNQIWGFDWQSEPFIL